MSNKSKADRMERKLRHERHKQGCGRYGHKGAFSLGAAICEVICLGCAASDAMPPGDAS